MKRLTVDSNGWENHVRYSFDHFNTNHSAKEFEIREIETPLGMNKFIEKHKSSLEAFSVCRYWLSLI